MSGDSWGRRLGRIWAQRLGDRPLGPDSTVAEIGPGFSAKIGFGLAELDFRGTVVLVEPNRQARRWARQEYQRLLPMARLRSSRRPVPDAGILAAGPVDTLMANHVLDDLLLNCHVSGSETDRIFGEMRPEAGCSERFAEIWRRLLGAPETLAELTERVVEDLVGYVDIVRPARLIVNEYQSWHHDQSGLGFIHEVSLWTLERLGQRLAGTGRLGAQLHSDDAAAIRWLVTTWDDTSGKEVDSWQQIRARRAL
jgi:hypothetical protein